MRNRIKDFLIRHLYSEELPLEYKIFNLVLIFGIFAEMIACVARIIEGVSLLAIVAVIVMIAITIIAFLLCTRYRLYKWGIPICLIFICDILFPIIFFTNGGINSGLTAFFVLCIILIFILLRRTACFIMTVVFLAIMTGCYIIENYYPHLVVPFPNDFVRNMDIIHSILIAGFLSGFLIKYQTRIYEREKQKAEAATKAKADFLANVSHEIRTPLNAIIGLGQLELAKKLPKETIINLEKMNSSGMSLLSIINNLLDISKIESGRFELIPVDYQTASFINDTVSLNMVRIGSKPITFQLDIDENLPRGLYGDELRLKQVLNNLLSNAFKYTKEGIVWLKIKSGSAAEDPNSPDTENKKINLICSIEDTGIGIKNEDMEKLFSDYNQVDTRSNRTIEGTGLGLSITKNLVELMGGTISLKSEYGKGSAFTVVIPQDVNDPNPIGSDLAERITKFQFYAERRSRKRRILNPMPYANVLVVDDVSTNLDVAKGMMLPYGFNIDCASSGKEAIRLIKEEKTIYDAVFMDHMMPGMDGLEAVKIIRNDISSDYARKVPIIALTANAILGNDKLFLDNGFQDYLTKPIDMSKMDIILNKWIRNREKEASPEWAPVIEKMKQEERLSNNEEMPPESAPKKEAASPAPVKTWPVISGIDFEGGISRMGGREAVYIRVLSSFAAGMPALLGKIRTFDPTKLEDYRINIHGIKGASYGIFANEIGMQAEALEMAAKAGDIETILARNDLFILSMEKLLGEISKYITSL